MQRSQITFNVRGKETAYDVTHNLDEYGEDIEAALLNWGERATVHSQQNFCEYVMEKNAAFFCIATEDKAKIRARIKEDFAARHRQAPPHLPGDTATQPDAIERLFCKPFEALGGEEMTKDLTQLFLQLHAIEKKGDGEAMFADLHEKDWAAKVLEKRLLLFTIKPSGAVKTLLTFLADNKLGVIVMYLTYLQYKRKGKAPAISFEELADMFPYGFPSDAALSTLWYSLKVKEKGVAGDKNLLDCMRAAESIF